MLDSDDFDPEDVLSFGAGADLYVKTKRKKQIRITLRLSQAEENSPRMYIYA